MSDDDDESVDLLDDESVDLLDEDAHIRVGQMDYRAESDEPSQVVQAELKRINAISKEKFHGVLECRWTCDKGRIMVVTRDFEQGELIAIENPLYIVEEESDNPAYIRLEELCLDYPDDFDYEPMWYWCGLRSLTREQIKGAYGGGWTAASSEIQQKLLMLHHTDESAERNPGRSTEIIRRELAPGVESSRLEALKQVWILNCFDYSDEPPGFATYFLTSFISHSCCPNVCTDYVGDRHALRARTRIAAGEEITLTYLTDERLLLSTPIRRWELWETKSFWCGCARCSSESDLSRGFRCPKCWKGIVFAPSPTGEAESEDPPDSDLIGVTCGSCGERITAKEASNLAQYEKAFKLIFEDLQKRDEYSKKNPVKEDEMKECEDFIDCFLIQHFQADLAWELLIKVYLRRKQRVNALHLLRRRCVFHEAAYQGLNPIHAMVLKALADELAKTEDSPSRTWDLLEAEHLYGKAMHILRLLYGDENEDVQDCEKKWRELQQASKIATGKRRRLLGKQQKPKG